jgi:hypothetical protein
MLLVPLGGADRADQRILAAVLIQANEIDLLALVVGLRALDVLYYIRRHL